MLVVIWDWLIGLCCWQYFAVGSVVGLIAGLCGRVSGCKDPFSVGLMFVVGALIWPIVLVLLATAIGAIASVSAVSGIGLGIQWLANKAGVK